jgi:hypothetical protein
VKFEDSLAQFENVASFDQAMVNVLATEVSTSLIFAKLARDTRDPDKRQMNLAHAKEGYAAALYFVRQADKRHDRVSVHIVEGMKALKSMLREMGQIPYDL